MCSPIEIATVHDGSSHVNSLSVHILGSGMCHNIGTPFNRAAVDRGREGIVNDERDSVAVSESGELLDIEHHYSGIGEGLTEDEFGIWSESLGNFLFRRI